MRATPSPETERVDAWARVLMAAWEKAEGKPVGVSYVATFADMARAVTARLDSAPDLHDAYHAAWQSARRRARIATEQRVVADRCMQRYHDGLQGAAAWGARQAVRVEHLEAIVADVRALAAEWKARGTLPVYESAAEIADLLIERLDAHEPSPDEDADWEYAAVRDDTGDVVGLGPTSLDNAREDVAAWTSHGYPCTIQRRRVMPWQATTEGGT